MRAVQQQRTAAERCSQPRIHKHGFMCMLLLKRSVSHLSELGDIERYVEQTRAGWSIAKTNTKGKHIEGQRENGMMRRVSIRLHAGSAAAANRGGAM